MKKLILALLMAMFLTQVFAWNWVKRAGGNQLDWPWSICADQNDNCYLTGSFQGEVDFGNASFTSTSPSSDLFITKLDAEGNFIWTLQGESIIGAVGLSVDLYDDYLYVTGYFVDSLYIDGVTLIGNGAWDTFILKCTLDGSVVTAKSFGGTQSEIGYGLSTNGANVFLTGWYNSDMNIEGQNVMTSGGSDIYIIQYDMDLNLVDIITGNGSEVNYAFEIDSDLNNFYVIGSSGGDLILNNINMQENDGSYLYIQSIDSNDYFYDVPLNASTMNVKVNENGEIFLVGNIYQQAQFGSIIVDGHGEDPDFYCAKMSPDHQWEWVRAYGSNNIDKGKDITTFSDKVYTISNFTDSLYIDNHLFVSQGNENIILLEFDNEGNVLSIHPAGGTSTTIASGLCASPNGTIFATGWFGGLSNFGNHSVSSSNDYDLDVFIAKLNVSNNNDNPDLEPKTQLNIYPNPVRMSQHQMLNFQIKGNLTEQIQKVSLYNIKGQLIESFPTHNTSIQIKNENYQNGIYFLRVQTNYQTFNKKLLILK